MEPKDIRSHPIHLGLGASAEIEPRYGGGMDWYLAYAQRHKADGREGRLVTMHTFSEPWDMWEMHPHGYEVVLCTSGSIKLHQEKTNGKVRTVSLSPGQYAINEPGTWHTADVESEATALFITAGLGTEHRSRHSS
ncbi:MAG TPA: hypothetical protein VGA60_16480 [Kiloniellales bacterium]|jgi:hypothetical protein